MTATPLDQHRRLRESRALRSAIVGLLFQGVYALAQFFVLGLLIRYVGRERVGTWITVASLTAWMGLMLLGIQYVILTTLGATALTDRAAAQRVLSTGVIFVGLVSLGVTGVVASSGLWLSWPNVLNVKGAAALGVTPLAITALAVAALSLPAMLAGHALQASQRGDLNYLCGVIAQFVMAASVFLGVRLGWPLAALGPIVAGAPLLGGVLQWILGLRQQILPPLAVSAFDGLLLRRFLRAGAVFVLLDLCTIALLQSGPMLLTHMQSPEAVVPYAAVSRLIGLPIAAFMMISYTYWPAYSEAEQRKDFAWIRIGLARSMKKMLVLWLLAAVPIVLVGRLFVTWWLGADVRPSYALLVAGISLALAQGLNALFAAPLGGMGRLRQQLVSAAVTIGIYVIAGVALCARYGATGLLTGQALGACAGAILNAFFVHRRLQQVATISATP